MNAILLKKVNSYSLKSPDNQSEPLFLAGMRRIFFTFAQGELGLKSQTVEKRLSRILFLQRVIV